MSNTLIIGLVTGLVAGAAAGGAVAFVLSPGGTPETQVAAASSKADLAGTVSRLTEENEALTRRVEVLETRNVMAEGAPAVREAVAFEGMGPTNEELHAMLEELAVALANPGADTAVNPGFRAMVDLAIEDREAQERAERDAEREQQRLQRNVDRVAKLTEDLGLEGWQSDEMVSIYTERDAAFEAIRDEMRENGLGGRNFRDAGDQFGAIREEYDAKIQNVLTVDQYTQYEEQNPGWGGFGGGRGGGGGGRGGI